MGVGGNDNSEVKIKTNMFIKTQLHCQPHQDGQLSHEGLANTHDAPCQCVLSKEEVGTKLPKALGSLPGDSLTGQSLVAQTQTGPQGGPGRGKVSSGRPVALQGGLVLGCGEGSPAISKASITSQGKACQLTPFGIGHSSVLPGDPPVRAGHSGTRGAKQEGVREEAASASGGKRVPCL